MPKSRQKEQVIAQNFRWLLGVRNGVFFADGRSNTIDAGRHSLGTKSRAEALKAIPELDLRIAVDHGLAPRSMLSTATSRSVSLEEGRRLYEEFVRRPAVANGPRPSTRKRYRAVLDKFIAFASGERVKTWNQVNSDLLNAYAAWLDDAGYAYATEYLELTTIKQILRFLVEHDHLPPAFLLKYPLKKPEGTSTYCYRPQEVAAILDHCDCEELLWMRHVVAGLAATGLRISELAALRWSDIDLEAGHITLTDESTFGLKTPRARRTTKSGRSRSFPIHKLLRFTLAVLDQHIDGYVFHGPLGGRLKADTVRRALIRDVLEPLAPRFPSKPGQAGFAAGRLHSFRHYFCSACANAGVPERVLMNWLGHTSSKMIHRYFHLHADESRQQMHRVRITNSTEPTPA